MEDYPHFSDEVDLPLAGIPLSPHQVFDTAKGDVEYTVTYRQELFWPSHGLPKIPNPPLGGARHFVSSLKWSYDDEHALKCHT